VASAIASIDLCRVYVIGHHLIVTGEVDAASAPRFAEALQSACWSARSAQEPVEVDLCRVDYFDSAGLTALQQCTDVELAVRYRRDSLVEKVLTLGLGQDPRVRLEPTG
jgi:ABC-type transporter Mla MlaB component